MPFGTREAAALRPRAGKPAPAGDLLEILVLEILAALLVRLWAAPIFVAVVEHFCVYLRIGVNVKIKNSSNGTITDFNGEFSIKASNGDILEISYVGYKPVTLTVSPGTSYNIIMKEDTETLEEVVVTALGIKRETKSLT